MRSRTDSRPAAPSADAGGGPSWIAATPGGCVLRVHARPGASRAAVAGLHGEALVVRVCARPVGGAANRELTKVLAQALAVRPTAVTLVSGKQGRHKRVHVDGVDVATALDRLRPFVDKAEAAD